MILSNEEDGTCTIRVPAVREFVVAGYAQEEALLLVEDSLKSMCELGVPPGRGFPVLLSSESFVMEIVIPTR